MSREQAAKMGNGLTKYISAFSGLLLPLVLAYLGHVYKESEAKDGIHEKYVEIAIDILKSAPTEEGEELRVWALNVLHEYSEVPIHPEARAHILKHGLDKGQLQKLSTK